MGSSKKDPKVILACSDCSNRNYSTVKSLSGASKRLALKKYCSHCATHTEHRETR